MLVHGAGSGPWVFERWPRFFPGAETTRVDLQQGRDVGTASMHDYADVVVATARRLPPPVALCGWSMGGLVALLAAERVRLTGIVLVEPRGLVLDPSVPEGVARWLGVARRSSSLPAR